MKVGTTMNRCKFLRGPAKKISETAVMHRAARMEDADAVHCC
jgi:hypothetical protein